MHRLFVRYLVHSPISPASQYDCVIGNIGLARRAAAFSDRGACLVARWRSQGGLEGLGSDSMLLVGGVVVVVVHSSLKLPSSKSQY